jgi:hypothetical protein
MAKLDQLARPVMRRTAGLEPDKAGRKRIEELQYLARLIDLVSTTRP